MLKLFDPSYIACLWPQLTEQISGAQSPAGTRTNRSWTCCGVGVVQSDDRSVLRVDGGVQHGQRDGPVVGVAAARLHLVGRQRRLRVDRHARPRHVQQLQLQRPQLQVVLQQQHRQHGHTILHYTTLHYTTQRPQLQVVLQQQHRQHGHTTLHYTTLHSGPSCR